MFGAKRSRWYGTMPKLTLSEELGRKFRKTCDFIPKVFHTFLHASAGTAQQIDAAVNTETQE